MNMKSVSEFKENIAGVLQLWIEGRINSLAENCPGLKVASVYLKRGVSNYILREREKIDVIIDNASLFICDENGNIDTETLFSDLMRMFHDMDEVPFGCGIIQGTVGKGVIRFALPDNAITNVLFGDTGAIRITESDILELKKMLTE